MNNRASCCRLPLNEGQDEGDINFRMHMNMPAILSNRSMFVTYYFDHLEDGSMRAMGSSRGNDEYHKVYEKEIGSDVIGQCHLVYLKATPCEGGMDLL